MRSQFFIDQALELWLEEKLSQVCLQLQIVDLVAHLEVDEDERDRFVRDHEISV
jgi:hypothetical protein